MFDIYDFDFDTRSVNLTFNVNDVKEIDEERQKVTFDMEIMASWEDSRISCLVCGAAAAEEKVTWQILVLKKIMFRHL